MKILITDYRNPLIDPEDPEIGRARVLLYEWKGHGSGWGHGSMKEYEGVWKKSYFSISHKGNSVREDEWRPLFFIFFYTLYISNIIYLIFIKVLYIREFILPWVFLPYIYGGVWPKIILLHTPSYSQNVNYPFVVWGSMKKKTHNHTIMDPPKMYTARKITFETILHTPQ